MRRQVQESTNRLQRINQQLNIIPLQIINQIRDNADRLLRLHHSEFSQLTNILQIATLLVIYYETAAHAFPQLVVLDEY